MNAHINLPALPPNIDDIVAGHDRAIELYAEAFIAIEKAQAAIQRAYAEVERVTPGATFHDPHDANEVSEFHKAVRLPERGVYMAVAQKLVTLRCWHYVVDKCGLQQLMDAQAKRELDSQLRYVSIRPKRGRNELIDEEEIAKGPPPFTGDNVRATIARFAGEAGMIWRRGIANAFSQLDRRFRSHDGFKVGSRLILTYFANSDGRVDCYGRSAETFRDIERTFQILDGRDPRNARSDFLHTVSQERDRSGMSWRPGQSEHENAYFKVRIFKNGNAHLWFVRDDLVEKVNKELAAYYGEVIGDARTEEPDIFEQRKTTPAKLHGFYPTPPDLAVKIARLACSTKPQRILEPSAGTGNLAYPIAAGHDFTDHAYSSSAYGKRIANTVDAIEVQPALATALRQSGKLARVITADFLRVAPSAMGGLYDGVVMNPPFDLERDIDHVTHALKFIKPDGFLLSIMSAGTEFRETRKAGAFRKLLADRKGWMIDLPPASFAEVGTYVNTVLVGFGLRRPYNI